MDRLTITGYSTALFSTWIFVEEMRLLFDAGDGVMSGLMHKAGKVRHVAMSHPDRDHVYGLMQLNHHAAHLGLQAVFYPAESGFFRGLQETCYRFDRETRDAYPWIPVKAGETHDLTPDLSLRVVPNTHIPIEGKSVGYVVMRRFRKLKPEFQALPQADLERIGRESGSQFLTEPKEEPLLGYSGDTGATPPDQWAGCKTLIHESTFLAHEDIETEREGYKHSALSDVLEMARKAGVGRLVLTHFSSRYKADEIVFAIKSASEALQIPFPVSALLPGRTVRDLLSGPPAWEGQSNDG